MFIRPMIGASNSAFSGLVAAYEMEGNDATSLLDSSGNGYHLSLNSTQPVQTAGLLGNARYSSVAATSYYYTTPNYLMAQSSWAIISWVKPTSTGGGWFEIDYPGERITAGYLSSRWFITSIAGSIGTLPLIIPGAFQMLALVYDGTDLRFSLNAGTPVLKTKSITGPATGFQLFRTDAGGMATNIEIDCWRFFDGEFSQDRIEQQYNGGAGVTYP